MAFNKFLLILLAVATPLITQAEFRDPTRPDYPLPAQTTATKATAIPDTRLVLSAIWISSKSRRATINGISAKVGQTILDGSVKVLKITRNTVTIQQNGTHKTLQLLHRPYKKR